MDFIKNIIKLLEWSCSWKYSFFRNKLDNRISPIVKYFDLRFDTRDMDLWLVSLDIDKEEKDFRVDSPEDFKELINYLNITEDREFKALTDNNDSYKKVDFFKIYNYDFNCYQDVDDHIIITYEEKEWLDI